MSSVVRRCPLSWGTAAPYNHAFPTYSLIDWDECKIMKTNEYKLNIASTKIHSPLLSPQTLLLDTWVTLIAWWWRITVFYQGKMNCQIKREKKCGRLILQENWVQQKWCPLLYYKFFLYSNMIISLSCSSGIPNTAISIPLPKNWILCSHILGINLWHHI